MVAELCGILTYPCPKQQFKSTSKKKKKEEEEEEALVKVII